jgi:hypothetical protein
MPFTADFDDIYKLGIQAACSDANVLAERVDEQTYSETILERIYRQIQIADFIIADMTGRNANVFYEVGYAHARAKLCTLLTQSADDIPFDLKHHRHIVYERSIQKLKEKLSLELAWLKAESGKLKSQSITIELGSGFGTLEKNEWSITGEMEIIFDLHNRSGKRSPDIEAFYIYTNHNWNFVQGNDDCPVTESPDAPAKLRNFVKPPVQRLLPGGWAQIKLKGSRRFWDKWSGEEAKEKYRTSSPIHIELHTSEGILRYAIPVAVDFEEVPF